MTREFSVFAPHGDDFASSPPRRVVFWFHGAAAYLTCLRVPDSHQDTAQAMSDLAQANDFIVVAAKGLNYEPCAGCDLLPGTYERRRRLNGREACSNFSFMGIWDIEHVDDSNRDVLLFDTMLEYVTTSFNADSQHIYVAGHSFGGFFTHLLAKLRSHKIAAIATHASGLDLQYAKVIRCNTPFNFYDHGVGAARPYPVLLARRILDPTIPQITVERAACRLEAEGHHVEVHTYSTDCEGDDFADCCAEIPPIPLCDGIAGRACASAGSNQHGVVPWQFGPDAWSFLSRYSLSSLLPGPEPTVE
jgi:poly(3-hydroxybutyrate) depolymerase